MKYTTTRVTMQEVPDEIALCINISNCPNRCKGCHSPELQDNIGKELTDDVLLSLIAKNEGITCVAFMGGDGDIQDVKDMLYVVKWNTNLKTAWYSGRETVDSEFLELLDYVKLGPYIEERGGLDNMNTNQRFFKVEDITYKFQNK